MKTLLRLLVLVMVGATSLLGQPAITAQPTNQMVLNGGNVTFSVAVAGTGPFTYQWQFNGTNLPNAIITTVAGNGKAVYSGDGGLADQSSISGSYGIVVDSIGNVFISDFSNSRVRKVDLNGIISTVAGNGTNSFSGDGGPATNACLGQPSGLALDTAGNLYIADYGNNDIRKVDTNGIISTFAGNGQGTYAGDGLPATNASLFNPYGLTFDSTGDLYIADSDNNVIRVINPAGIIATVPAYGLVYPTGMGLDSSGNLYIADCNGNTVVKLDTNGMTTTFAGNGGTDAIDGIPAVSSGVSYPRDVATDTNGNVFIAAFYDNRVRVVDTNGIINTVAGSTNGGFSGDNGDALNAGFYYLNAMARDSQGNVYVSDFFNYRVREISYSGPTLNFRNVTTNLSGNYSVVVSTLSGSITSSVASLNVVVPPTIAVQPNPQQILVGSNVIFSISAYGSTPMNYQWKFNGTNINGATNNAFVIGVVATNDAGNYSVTITNNYGSVTSSLAALTVIVILPGVGSQPASQTVPYGSNTVFGITASGSPPFNYQWFFNGTAMDGQTNSILTLPAVATNEAGAYSVLISSPYGSITSHVASLTVAWYPIITAQPTNQSLLVGSRTLLVANVTGVGPLTFQWQLNGTNLPNNLIATIAGNGTRGFAGDGGLATTGEIYLPFGVASDSSGNAIIADTDNVRIRRVSTNGVLSSLAGLGAEGYSGDGGPATNARIAFPAGLAVDVTGDILIADTLNNRIRQVNPNGIISTVAGSASGILGDGGPATNASIHGPYGVAVDVLGNLFVADTQNNRVRKIDTNGIISTLAGKSSNGFSGDGGLATNATLYQPNGVAVDLAGNIFIADTANHRVRKVDANGVITTIAGNGSSLYSGDAGIATNAGVNPIGVAVDNYGDVYVADSNNNRIRQVDPFGIIRTVAGNGGSIYIGDGITATNASLNLPEGVALDNYGRILVADSNDNRIRRFGQGPTLLIDSLAITNAGKYTLIVNSSFGSVTSSVATLTVLLPPTITNPLANQTAGLGSNATFTVSVTGTAPLAYQWLMSGTNLPNQTGPVLSLTNVQWSDSGNYSVIITNVTGSVTSSVAILTVVWPPAITNQPVSMTAIAGGQVMLSVGVSGTGPFSYQWQLNSTKLPDGIISTVAGTGVSGFSGDGGYATSAQLSPHGVAVDAYGNIYSAEMASQRVRRVDTNGFISTVAGNGTANYLGDGGLATNAELKEPSDVALDTFGNLYIADNYNERIRRVDTNGMISAIAGDNAYGYTGDGVPATNTSLYSPWSVALDAAGNLFFSDEYNNRVRKVNSNGIITTVAGGGTTTPTNGLAATSARLSGPLGMAVDTTGNLYFAQNAYYRIYSVSTNGILLSVAGNGTNGYSGDGGLATNANLSVPYGLAVDAVGNLFFADTSNYRIRKVATNGIITTVAGNGTYGFSGDGGSATSAELRQPTDVAVDSADNLFIADAINYRIRKVTNTRLPFLTLNNLTLGNAGSYQVTVTGPGGVLTSTNVTLTVLLVPVISPPLVNADGSMTLNISTTPNISSRIFVATNLSPPVIWQPVYTNSVGGNWKYTDPYAALQTLKFFRITTP